MLILWIILKEKKIMNKNTTRLTSGSFPVKSFIENVTFNKIVTFTHVAKATTAKMVEFFNHQAFFSKYIICPLKYSQDQS